MMTQGELHKQLSSDNILVMDENSVSASSHSQMFSDDLVCLASLCFLIFHAEELFYHIAEDVQDDLVKGYWDLKLICAKVVVFGKSKRDQSVQFFRDH